MWGLCTVLLSLVMLCLVDITKKPVCVSFLICYSLWGQTDEAFMWGAEGIEEGLDGVEGGETAVRI